MPLLILAFLCACGLSRAGLANSDVLQPLVINQYLTSSPAPVNNPAQAKKDTDEPIVDRYIDLHALQEPGDFADFVAGYESRTASPFNADALQEKSKLIYDSTSCNLFDNEVPSRFDCVLSVVFPKTDANESLLPWRWLQKIIPFSEKEEGETSLLRFRWTLRSIHDQPGEFFQVQAREDVVKPAFRSGGVVQYSPEEHLGVATVSCADPAPRSEQSSKFCDFDLRLAFVITSAQNASRFPSLFRTVGYDWISRAEVPPPFPYFHEIFAIASLHKVSQRILEMRRQVTVEKEGVVIPVGTVDNLIGFLSSDGDIAKAMESVRVGNDSDYQLGLSRGACSLVHWAGQRPEQDGNDGAESRWDSFVPRAFTPILSNSHRTFVLDEQHSVPCVLFINWRVNELGYKTLSRIFDRRSFPVGYRTGMIHYSRLEAEADSQSRVEVLALRGTATLLYMLGYDVTFLSEEQISGQWPRAGFLVHALSKTYFSWVDGGDALC